MTASATARSLPLLLAIALVGCDDGEPLPPAKAPPPARATSDAPPPPQVAPPAAKPAAAEISAQRTGEALDEDESDSADAQGVPEAPPARPVAPGPAAAPAPQPSTEKWMEVETWDVAYGGKKLRALRIGPPQGRAVLLLHGAKFSSRTWLELGTLEILAKNGFRAVAIDLPGFARSADVVAKPEEFLHVALPILDLKKPVVLFPSMSGSFAFPEAVDHPGEIAGLVPVAPVEIEKWAPKLKGSPLPTLLFWGEKDKVIPIAQAELLVAALPNLKKVVLAGADHPCYQDRPEEFHKALISFLRSLDAKK
jgi:abhydrolase domain-containing protein 14